MDKLEYRDRAAGGYGEGALPRYTLEDWVSSPDRGPACVIVPGDADLTGLYPRLMEAARIVIEFPSFMDGRAFSHARKLKASGYGGQLIASGDVLADQWHFLQRCGFDSLGDAGTADRADTLQRVSETYQGDLQDERPVFRRSLRQA